jgi:hypothetical protein
MILIYNYEDFKELHLILPYIYTVHLIIIHYLCPDHNLLITIMWFIIMQIMENLIFSHQIH